MSKTIRSIRSFTREKNIFCIEGSWDSDHRNKTSVERALDFFECIEQVKTTTRKCYNKETLKDILSESMQSKYRKYSIIYLAFHGEPNAIHLGRRNKKANLEEIADIINGKANGKIIHFGACSTLNVSQSKLNKFLENTNALAISGYKTDIDFIKSAALDLLYFQQCQKTVDIRTIKTRMNEYYRKLSKDLGFVIKYWA
jgi:hypothetical protein